MSILPLYVCIYIYPVYRAITAILHRIVSTREEKHEERSWHPPVKPQMGYVPRAKHLYIFLEPIWHLIILEEYVFFLQKLVFNMFQVGK